MNIKRICSLNFWKINNVGYRQKIEYDMKLYETWSQRHISRKEHKTIEWKYIICLRKAQANVNNIWGQLYSRKLRKLTKKTGIWIPAEIKCGNGLIIAHWGRIIVNPRTIIGDDFSISSGVVIGRDIRGKRAGTPVLGNRVCIKTNAVIVGNVHIGNDVLIAPNAYVNFDVPDHSIVIGNPGKIIHRDAATEGYI